MLQGVIVAAVLSAVAAPPAAATPQGCEVPGSHSYASPRLQQQQEHWQPGLDYVRIVPSQAERAPGGRVVVRVYFLYTASVSREFRRQLMPWYERRRNEVVLIEDPAVKWPHSEAFAQMFFTLAALGRDEHQAALFDWIWESDHFPIYHTPLNPDLAGIDRLNRQFAQGHGIDSAAFERIYASAEIRREVVTARERGYAAGALVVVNGRYGTSFARMAHANLIHMNTPANFERLLRWVDDFVRFEQQCAR